MLPRGQSPLIKAEGLFPGVLRDAVIAEANGMTKRLVASREEVPGPQRKPKRPVRVHVDVPSHLDSDP